MGSRSVGATLCDPRFLGVDDALSSDPAAGFEVDAVFFAGATTVKATV